MFAWTHADDDGTKSRTDVQAVLRKLKEAEPSEPSGDGTQIPYKTAQLAPISFDSQSKVIVMALTTPADDVSAL